MAAINPHLSKMNEDYLYHLGMGTTDDLAKRFGDVKFVCMGGSANRMRNFAQLLNEKLDLEDPNIPLMDLTGHAERYSMFKVGPVLSVNHGIGFSSMLVLLHEIIKLLHHAKCEDVTIIRIGTSGGIGLDPGTVVLTESAVDEYLNNFLQTAVAGVKVKRECRFSHPLLDELKGVGEMNFSFPIRIGKTMTSMDFYEGQGRLDGAICNYEEKDKMKYLQTLADDGVVNIEMEALAFGALLTQCHIKGTVVCVTMLDRLKGDQILCNHDTKKEYELRPQLLVIEFIKQRLLKLFILKK